MLKSLTCLGCEIQSTWRPDFFYVCWFVRRFMQLPATRLMCCLSPSSSRSAWSNLLSGITFEMLLCGHVLDRLIIVLCQSVTGASASDSLMRTLECMLWLSQTGAEISCVSTEVESESRWSWTVALYAPEENGYYSPETNSFHGKRWLRMRKLIWPD